MDKVRQDFARKIVERCKVLGWNQSELARRADLKRDNISGYIRGKNLPNSGHLAKLARALRVEPGFLLGAAYQERFPAMAGPDEAALPVFRMEELPDQPGHVRLSLKKTLTHEQADRIMQILRESRDGDSRKK